jgi:hypothetical protein
MLERRGVHPLGQRAGLDVIHNEVSLISGTSLWAGAGPQFSSVT